MCMIGILVDLHPTYLAAVVASGLCSAFLGTDGGGPVRILSALCCVVGFKTTYGRTDMRGAFCGAGTVEIIGPIASLVEDAMLVLYTMMKMLRQKLALAMSMDDPTSTTIMRETRKSDEVAY